MLRRFAVARTGPRPSPVLGLFFALVLPACGGGAATAPAVEAPAAAGPALPGEGDLPLLLPAGAELVLAGSPRRLLTEEPLAEVTGVVVEDGRWEAVARRTGIDAREIQEAVYAGYPEGHLWLLRLPQAPEVVQAAEGRMNTVEVASDEPFVRRAGYVGPVLREFVALSRDVLLVAEGAVGGRVVALLARATTGRFPGDEGGVYDPRALSALREAHAGAPVALHVPKHLDLPPDSGAALLLARQTALAAHVAAGDAGELAVEVELLGEFPPGAEHNFRALVESIAASDLGGALGIREALPTLSVRVDDTSVLLRLRPAARTLARGLSLLFVAELRDILGEPPDAAPRPM